MKHFGLTLIGSLALSTTFAQNLPVDQNVTARKAVVEEFTAYKCGNCPAGHEALVNTAQVLGEENLIVIGYHYGGLANPNQGDPDYRTSEGNALGPFFSIAGTPQGPVNRSSFGGSSFVIGASNWGVNAQTIVGQNADVNLALDVTIDAATREATINTEAFYTTNSASTHYLTIGYTQSELVSAQTSYNPSWNAAYFNQDGTYRHQHVFRGIINTSAGTPLDASSTSVITNDYNFTVPADIAGVPVDLSNLEFYAIIHEGENGPTDSEILNGAKTSPVVNGLSIDEQAALDIEIFPNPSEGSATIHGLNEKQNIVITDQLGKQVRFEQTGNQISGLDSGLYFVHVSENAASTTLRLLVK